MSRKAGKSLHSMSIPEAGAEYLGLGRNASYAAAGAGLIPYIEIGRLKRVPRRLMERLMDTAGKKNRKAKAHRRRSHHAVVAEHPVEAA